MTTDGTDATTRRTYLLAVARNLGGRVTTQQALQIYAVSPWRTVGRNTARRDLRDLARRGYLIPDDEANQRSYSLGDNPEPVHPFRLRGRSLRDELLDEIRRDGGEWTAGRAKAVCRRILGTHFYRTAARRLLSNLHWLGHLDRHGDDTARLYYTLRRGGGTA